MRVFEDAWRRDDLPLGAVVTIGNFDGLHLGQQELIRTARARAGEQGVESLVITFEPHPLKILRPEQAPRRLTTPKQKLSLLAETGVDGVAIIEFTPEFAQTSAAAFVEAFLGGRLKAREVHVGSRFTFGRGREGSLGYLLERGAELGFSAHGVPEVLSGGEPISSTRVRGLIAEGRVEEAREMLGRAFAVTGTVEVGEARGRELGWPTANLAVENELIPENGVYATEVVLASEVGKRPAVTNIGTRPTFNASERRHVESHLLDFDGDLYGSPIELRFCSRLRGERRFESPGELVAQIERDVGATREYFSTCAC